MTFEVPMSLIEHSPQSFSLTGTPADCVRVALSQLDVEFDWVLSGINNGSNLGTDVYVSGTVAAAREATYFGVRSMALSQYLQQFRTDFEWELAGQLTEQVLTQLFSSDLKPGEYFNINFPDTQGASIDSAKLVLTQLNRHPIPTSYEKIDSENLIYNGSYHQRLRDPETDVSVCFAGNISLTRHFPNG